jgi:non-heme chloroperoxidase
VVAGFTPHEQQEIDRANASGRQPVVFVHGLWLLPSSWDLWRTFFEQHGYTALAPGWPDDPETVEEARAHPDVFAKKSLRIIEAHFAEVIRALDLKPAVIGHSFGGVITEELAGRGLSAASVAIDPAPFRGVISLQASVLKAGAALLVNPGNYGRAIALTFEQFNFAWGNAVSEDESRELYETYHVAGAGRPLFSAAFANVNPWTEDRVDTQNPDRGPLLLISGEKDNTVPWASVHAAFERQESNPGITKLAPIENRGHSLTIDSGWREVADMALAFVQEHAPARVASNV